MLGSPITHCIISTHVIDTRTLLRIHFLILDLGSSEVILGYQWLKYFKEKVDAASDHLEWPHSLQKYINKSLAPRLLTPFSRLGKQPLEHHYQTDARRRNLALVNEAQRRASGRASSPNLFSIPTCTQSWLRVIHLEPLRPFLE